MKGVILIRLNSMSQCAANHKENLGTYGRAPYSCVDNKNVGVGNEKREKKIMYEPVPL